MTGFYWILLALVVGCNKSPDDPTVIIDINDELNITMWETLVDGESEFTFKLETINHQSCENYKFDYTLDQNSRNVKLSINSLVLPDNCIPGNVPTRESIAIGPLDPNTYDLEINLNNNEIINTGRLLVSFSQYNLLMDSDHGIIIPDEILYRIPKNAIWGYIGINNSSQELSIRSDFESKINDFVEDHDYTSGYYGHFDLAEDNTVSISADKAYARQFNFLYKSFESEEVLKSIIDDFRLEYGNSIEIKVFTAKGTIL